MRALAFCNAQSSPDEEGQGAGPCCSSARAGTPPLQAPAVGLRPLSPAQNSHGPCTCACAHHFAEGSSPHRESYRPRLPYGVTVFETHTLPVPSLVLFAPHSAAFQELPLGFARYKEETGGGGQRPPQWVCPGVPRSPPDIPE